MNPFLPAELPVVVDDRVERDVSVGHVVPEHGRALEHPFHVTGAERGDELVVDLPDAPGEPTPLHRRGSVALQVLALRAGDLARRQIVERIEVEEVAPLLVLTERLPEVRVDRVSAQEGGVAGEQLPERLGQRARRPRVHQPVDLETPRPGGHRNGQERDDQEDGRASPAGHYCRCSEIEKGRPSRRPLASSDDAP